MKLTKLIKHLQTLFEEHGDLTMLESRHGDLFILEESETVKTLSVDSVITLHAIEMLFPDWCGKDETITELKPIKVGILNCGSQYVCDYIDLN